MKIKQTQHKTDKNKKITIFQEASHWKSNPHMPENMGFLVPKRNAFFDPARHLDLRTHFIVSANIFFATK